MLDSNKLSLQSQFVHLLQFFNLYNFDKLMFSIMRVKKLKTQIV